MSTLLKIAIAGAGPGGLMLARLLQMRGGFEVTVFEADANADARRQGGSLDLHADSGLQAINEAGLRDVFDRIARYDDQADSLYDHLGNLITAHDFSDAERPEIDRSQLRDLLLGSLRPDTVRWGWKILDVVPHAEGGHEIVGESERTGPFALVVGADGAWSRVRKCLTDAVPLPTRLVYFEWGIDNIDDRYPALANILPKGKTAVIAADRGFIAQRSSGGKVKVFLILRDPDGEVASKGPRDQVGADVLLAMMQGWADSMTAFARAASGPALMRDLRVLPDRLTWPTRPGLTLLGDAAHVMAPFGGEGVNMALEDARQLAHRLIAHTDWNVAIAEYEREMFARTGAAAERSNAAASVWPRETLALMAQLKQASPEPGLAVVSRPGTLEERVHARLAHKTLESRLQKSMGAALRFDIAGVDGGSWVVDFRPDSAGIRPGGSETAKCTLAMASADFAEMLERRLDPRVAFFRNKLKINGDMTLAIRLGEVLRE